MGGGLTLFREFDRSVRSAFRYARTPEQIGFLNTVTETSERRVLNIPRGAVFHRAQLGHGWMKEDTGSGNYVEFPAAHRPSRMVPSAEYVGDGRVNAKGIVCLYLATNEETAALEVRPLIGSYVSIAKFQIARDLRVVDCSQKLVSNMLRYFKPDLTPEEIELIVWNDINDAFSAPVERADAGLTYIPTQIIAETLRLQGYDGVAYKSGYGEKGGNVALFDVNAAELRTCALHRVMQMRVGLEGADNPYYVVGDKLVQNEIVDIRPAEEWQPDAPE